MHSPQSRSSTVLQSKSTNQASASLSRSPPTLNALDLRNESPGAAAELQRRIAVVNLLFHETVLLLYRWDRKREAYVSAAEVIRIFYAEYKASTDVGRKDGGDDEPSTSQESKFGLLPSFTFLAPQKIYAAAMLLLHAYCPPVSRFPRDTPVADRSGHVSGVEDGPPPPGTLPVGSRVIQSYVRALEMLEYCETRWKGAKGMRNSLMTMGEAVLGGQVEDNAA
jgi:hypothetical protein